MRIPRKDIFIYDQFYHVMNKFNPELMLKRKHLDKIQEIIKEEAKEAPEVKIVNSNILQNHYHMLVLVNEQEYKKRCPNEKRLGISVFMQKLNTKIAQYVNRVKNRHGKVFYDRYKSLLVNTLDYFKNAFAYIMNNAEKHYNILKEKWNFSGWHFYNKTEEVKDDFLVRYEELAEKVYGVRPVGLENLPLPSKMPFCWYD